MNQIKVALLSDIHSNFDALSAVFKTTQFNDCDIRINCGDLVGYYFEPKKVFDSIRQMQFYSVKGNHEEILEIAKNDVDYLKQLVLSKIYGKSHEYALKQLNNEDLSYLFSLPINLEVQMPQGKLHICHGSPLSTNDYLYPDTYFNVKDFNLRNDIKWLILGNTHIQMEKKMNGLRIINPGSVGQARDGSGLAQWAILDTTSDKVEFQNTTYRKNKLIANIKRISPSFPKLWQSIGGS